MAFSSSDDPGYCVRLIDPDGIGRGVFATKTFRKGETVFKEDPVVLAQFAYNKDFGYSACQHCFEPLESAEQCIRRLTNNPGVILPEAERLCPTRAAFHASCPQCGEAYCSQVRDIVILYLRTVATETYSLQQCLDDAFTSYHKVMCLGCHPSECPEHPYLQLIRAWQDIHKPPETMSIELLGRVLASVILADDPDAKAAVYTTLMHATVTDDGEDDPLRHRLLGEQYRGAVEDLRRRFEGLFGSQPCVARFLTPDGFDGLLALAARNQQGVASNAFATYAKKLESHVEGTADEAQTGQLLDVLYGEVEAHVGMDFMDAEGTGLYSGQAMLNHSCRPNAEIAFPFNNATLAVNATSAIEPGEQIFISYLDPCVLERSRHSRNRVLKENYLFSCGCEKCFEQKDDESVTSEEDMEDEEEEEEDIEEED